MKVRQVCLYEEFVRCPGGCGLGLGEWVFPDCPGNQPVSRMVALEPMLESLIGPAETSAHSHSDDQAKEVGDAAVPKGPPPYVGGYLCFSFAGAIGGLAAAFVWCAPTNWRIPKANVPKARSAIRKKMILWLRFIKAAELAIAQT